MENEIKQLAQLYWKCWDIIIESNQWAEDRPSEETYRAATACVFIEANKRGLATMQTRSVPTAGAKAERVNQAAGSPSSWKDTQIHFGKNKGAPLGSLSNNWLRWYIEKWQPQSYKGSISANDKMLRAALDQARESLTLGVPDDLEPPF